MDRKYLFFDYDGTLRSRARDVVPESAQRALQMLRDRGHFVSLATGRLQMNAMQLLEGTGITSFVGDGGHSITIDGKLVWMEGMPLEPCKRFLHWLDEHGRPWAVMVANEMQRYTRDERFGQLAQDAFFRTVIAPGLDIDKLDVVNKIFVPCLADEERGFEFFGVTHARYMPTLLYCEPTDKAYGIKKFMGMMNAPCSSVVVFGDGTNDESMFLPEWTCVAMGNAVDALKEKADLVTAGVDEDGVYLACKRLGLI
jgi:HAD superfamily hydrolase (TIGR01484 family)